MAKASRNVKTTAVLLEEAAALRKLIAADTSVNKQASAKAVWELVPQLVPIRKPKEYRPFPVKRPFEITAEERAAMEVVVDAGVQAAYFTAHGFCEMASDLARFIGAAAPNALDTPVVVDGKPHPAWCLVSDALYGHRSTDDVLDLLATLPTQSQSALWTELCTTRSCHLNDPLPRTPEELAKGLTPNLVGEHLRRVVGLLVDFNVRLGDHGAPLAHALISESTASMLPLLVALSSLAERARRAGSVLDAAFAPLIDVVALGAGNFELVASIIDLLERLPKEWAVAAAQGEIQLVERFPSREGAEKVIRLFESVDPITSSRFRGAYYEGLFVSMLRAVGEPAIELLDESIARDHPNKKLMTAQRAKLSAKKTPKKK